MINSLQPDHNRAAFRKDNAKAIKKVFRATVQVAKHFKLIGGSLLAGDSTRLRAQNSKKNNRAPMRYNQKKIERHLAYIENKLEEYTQALSEADRDVEKRQKIEEKIASLQQRRQGYEQLEKELKASDEKQISLSDPESSGAPPGLIMIRGNIRTGDPVRSSLQHTDYGRCSTLSAHRLPGH